VVGKTQKSFFGVSMRRAANSVARGVISEMPEINPKLPAVGGHEDGAVGARIDQE